MEPPIPWPQDPGGYTPREEIFVKAYRAEGRRADRNRRWVISLTTSLSISLALLGVSLAFGQQSQTLIIDHLDPNESVILEIYRDQNNFNHYYVFDIEGGLTEIWVNPYSSPSTLIPESRETGSSETFFDKDFSSEKENWWELPDTSSLDFQLEYLYNND